MNAAGKTPTNPAAFSRSLKDRLKNQTGVRNRTIEQLRREFFLQRFLARVFSSSEGRWMLKGGASLLVRRPDARYSQDIDLLHTSAAVEEAMAELIAIADTPTELDFFRFVFDTPRLMTGGVAGASVKVRVYVGAQQLADFPIDLSTELSPVGTVEFHSPIPVIELDGLAPMPKFALYPLPQQISDKVCAMYERYGQLNLNTPMK
ncbi:nucleotidyl transferase AbiEii/AbiGii toxin family protein [Rhodococcus sp. G-MC3]|uniref:nucleotidyl transferase AbiEii/AbiGii toxin family protein n=1 Tax=Rhodococcus sp. G-MC3 TaxID=3046209 RepID=UPI0024BB63F8|nr:nucleotidyl transferase AbiEii/AbiGii toxin family protein [Rhodococcus sp. G-MC3]MDJ0394236.1 nucleotidyl transferase AbiEii/AbiGii toxin family protein [Rhodococcus sp. G-MC3]